jgi:hypothetical protein
MARYIIERQYLVPMFEHILIEAPTFEDACREAVDDIAQPWSKAAELCFDDARATTITYAVELPDGYEQARMEGGLGETESLSSLLYCADLEPLPIPDEFGEPSQRHEGEGIGFV